MSSLAFLERMLIELAKRRWTSWFCRYKGSYPFNRSMRALNVRPDDIGFVKISATLRAVGTETGSISPEAVASRKNMSRTSRCRILGNHLSDVATVFAAELSSKIGIVTLVSTNEKSLRRWSTYIASRAHSLPMSISDSQDESETSMPLLLRKSLAVQMIGPK